MASDYGRIRDRLTRQRSTRIVSLFSLREDARSKLWFPGLSWRAPLALLSCPQRHSYPFSLLHQRPPRAEPLLLTYDASLLSLYLHRPFRVPKHTSLLSTDHFRPLFRLRDPRMALPATDRASLFHHRHCSCFAADETLLCCVDRALLPGRQTTRLLATRQGLLSFLHQRSSFSARK